MPCSHHSSNDTIAKDTLTYCYVSEDSHTFTSSVARISQVFAIGVLQLLCLLGNGLMIYAVVKSKARGSALSASSLLLVNLSVADLLVGTLVLPMWMVTTVTLSWPLPVLLCSLTAFLTVALMVASIFSLSAIALDRYLNLAYPLRYPGEVTPKRLVLVFLALWTICIFVAGLPLLGWGEYRFQPQTVPICNPVWVTQVGYTIFLILVGLTLPFAVMLAAYVRIVQIAKKHITSIEVTLGVVENHHLYNRRFTNTDEDFNQAKGQIATIEVTKASLDVLGSVRDLHRNRQITNIEASHASIGMGGIGDLGYAKRPITSIQVIEASLDVPGSVGDLHHTDASQASVGMGSCRGDFKHAKGYITDGNTTTGANQNLGGNDKTKSGKREIHSQTLCENGHTKTLSSRDLHRQRSNTILCLDQNSNAKYSSNSLLAGDVTSYHTQKQNNLSDRKKTNSDSKNTNSYTKNKPSDRKNPNSDRKNKHSDRKNTNSDRQNPNSATKNPNDEKNPNSDTKPPNSDTKTDNKGKNPDVVISYAESKSSSSSSMTSHEKSKTSPGMTSQVTSPRMELLQPAQNTLRAPLRVQSEQQTTDSGLLFSSVSLRQPQTITPKNSRVTSNLRDSSPLVTSPRASLSGASRVTSNLSVARGSTPSVTSARGSIGRASGSRTISSHVTRRVFSRSVKTANRVFVAVGVFFLCWGPYVILNFWSVNHDDQPVPYAADLLTTLLAFANSSINPVLFLLINKDYRTRVRMLGRKCWLNCDRKCLQTSDRKCAKTRAKRTRVQPAVADDGNGERRVIREGWMAGRERVSRVSGLFEGDSVATTLNG